MPEGNYFVRVFVDGEAVPVPAHCGHIEGIEHQCMFTVSNQFGSEFLREAILHQAYWYRVLWNKGGDMPGRQLG